MTKNIIGVSVLMCCYNSQLHIRAAINSIINQTYKNFELIIVNDGSTDNTEREIERFNDPRISYIALPRNKGVSYARNVGLAMAKSDLVAIMDSDDIAHPRRLEKQILIMHKNKDLTILGTDVIKSVGNKKILMKYPNNDGLIKARLLALNGSALINPSTIMRMHHLEDNGILYPGRKTDEDHWLWFECTKKNLKFGSTEEPLLIYRRHDFNTTSENSNFYQKHIKEKTSLRKSILLEYFKNLDTNEANNVAQALNGQIPVSMSKRTITKVSEYNESHHGESIIAKKAIATSFLKFAR